MTALLLLLATADRTYSLEWKPKQGETHLYHVVVRFDYGGNELRFDTDLKTLVLGVASDGSYRVETRSLNAVARTADEKHELPAQPPQTQRYDRRGLPLELKASARDSDPFADLLDHLTEFQTPGRPVAIGGKWLNSVAGPKDSLFGVPRITYELDSVSESGAGSHANVRYTATSGFDRNAATGNLILTRPSNSLSHMDVKIPHFQPEGSNEVASVSIVLDEK